MTNTPLPTQTHYTAPTLAPCTTKEAQEMVRAAPDTAFFPRGGGTRHSVGYAAAREGVVLSTQMLTGVVEYNPADLVVTAQAGTTVAALQEALARHRQWLPLGVARPDMQTLGGIVAGRAHSLLRLGCGSVRDSLLGVQVIHADGEMVQGGGRVMKNVSGYDLPKLFCGSWGTLGLIVETTWKVAPLPEASATVALPLANERNSEEVLDALLASPLVPSMLVLLSPQAACSVLNKDAEAQYLVIGFDGLADDVAWQVEALGADDSPLPAPAAEAVRARLRDFSLQDAPLAGTFHILSSQVGAYSRMMEGMARRWGFAASVVSDAALGIVHAHFFPIQDATDWHAFHADLSDKAARVGGSFIAERLPDTLRDAGVPVWSPVLPEVEIMRRIKTALDPRRQWNPGRFLGL